jgi:hypothetical protein
VEEWRSRGVEEWRSREVQGSRGREVEESRVESTDAIAAFDFQLLGLMRQLGIESKGRKSGSTCSF